MIKCKGDNMDLNRNTYAEIETKSAAGKAKFKTTLLSAWV